MAVIRAHWYLRKAELESRRVRMWGHPRIYAKGRIIISDRVRINSAFAKVELAAEIGATLRLGKGTFLNFGSNIAASQSVTIGPYCNIGPYCLIMDNAYHCVEPDRRQERPESRPIVLGRNVWLGARVIVLPGVTIGDHSVIGAGSVVSRDIPSRVFAAGVPAEVLRQI